MPVLAESTYYSKPPYVMLLSGIGQDRVSTSINIKLLPEVRQLAGIEPGVEALEATDCAVLVR